MEKINNNWFLKNTIHTIRVHNDVQKYETSTKYQNYNIKTHD